MTPSNATNSESEKDYLTQDEPPDPFAGPGAPNEFLLRAIKAVAVICVSVIGGLLLLSVVRPVANKARAVVAERREAKAKAAELRATLVDDSEEEEAATGPRQVGVMERQEIFRQVQIAERLANKHRKRQVLTMHKNQIAARYGVSVARLREIQLEGLTLSWPDPAPDEELLASAEPAQEEKSLLGSLVARKKERRTASSSGAGAASSAVSATPQPPPVVAVSTPRPAPQAVPQRVAYTPGGVEATREESVAAEPIPMTLRLGDELELTAPVGIHWRYEFRDPLAGFKDLRKVPAGTLLDIKGVDLLRYEVEVSLGLGWKIGTGWIDARELRPGTYTQAVHSF